MKPFDVIDHSLQDLLNLERYKLEIPAYQRPYEWKEKDVVKLLNDVKSSSGKTAAENYLLLGSVLLYSTAAGRQLAGVRSCDVVDGQQRLSTIMLLYSALYQRGQEIQQYPQLNSDKLQSALNAMMERFRSEEDTRILEVQHALGGTADEDMSSVEGSWKTLTVFGNTALDTEDMPQKVDRYFMRWNNILKWVRVQCKSAAQVLKLLDHLDTKVFVSVTLIYDVRLALKCFVNCNTTGVPLAPSDILKVLLVSKKGTRATFPLLQTWNDCKVDLLKASHSLKRQSGKTFWGKALASKTVKLGLSEFQTTSMDDLLAHLKAINDPTCKFLQMSYMDYMAEHYTYGSNTKDKGLHHMPNEFATDVLERYCKALIDLFNGRPFAETHLQFESSVLVNDFKHIIQGLLALDDADWRPVALVAMIKAEKSRKKGVKGVLEALVKFMLNLEHLAVLLALLNTKKAGQTAMWRKKQYGKIMQLLDQQLVGHELYVKQLNQVMSKMWASLPDVQRLGSAGKEKLHLGSALQRLGLMHIYVDSKADQTREDLAECKACTSQNADAEAAAEAEAEAEVAADADEDSDTADAEYGDDDQSQPGEEDGVAAKRPDSAQASQTTIPSGSGSVAFTKAAEIARDKLSVKNNRLARALLLMLEHEGTNRKKTGAPKWTGKISIEHILPRNISKPGAGWNRHWTAEKQSEWLHRLGNLAMLNDSDNSSLGNCGFQAKIAKIKKFQNSASWTIRDLLDNHEHSDWDDVSIQSRHKRLLEVFQRRWGVEAFSRIGKATKAEPLHTAATASTASKDAPASAAAAAGVKKGGKSKAQHSKVSGEPLGSTEEAGTKKSLNKGKPAAGSAKKDVKGKSGIAGQTGSNSKASADGSVAESGNAAEDDWIFGGGSKAGVMSNSHERELLEASAAGAGNNNGSTVQALGHFMDVDATAAAAHDGPSSKRTKPQLAAPNSKGVKATCFMLVPQETKRAPFQLMLSPKKPCRVGGLEADDGIKIPNRTVPERCAIISSSKHGKQIKLYARTTGGTSVDGRVLAHEEECEVEVGSVIKFGYHSGFQSAAKPTVEGEAYTLAWKEWTDSGDD